MFWVLINRSRVETIIISIFDICIVITILYLFIEIYLSSTLQPSYPSSNMWLASSCATLLKQKIHRYQFKFQICLNSSLDPLTRNPQPQHEKKVIKIIIHDVGIRDKWEKGHEKPFDTKPTTANIQFLL